MIEYIMFYWKQLKSPYSEDLNSECQEVLERYLDVSIEE